MELTGDSLIAAPRTTVWAALNDPAVLARCIEGVETLTASVGDDGATRLDGKMNARVGPVRATFAGGVTMTEVDAPNRYVLVGEGKGGVAGFAKGSAEVTLTDADVDGTGGATRLVYVVTSSVGGKLAQLGARLIEGTARGYAETFFTRFKAEVETPLVVASGSSGDAGVDAEKVDHALAEPGRPASASPSILASEASLPGSSNAAQNLDKSASRPGLTPLVWGGVLIAIVIAVLIWQLA